MLAILSKTNSSVLDDKRTNLRSKNYHATIHLTQIGLVACFLNDHSIFKMIKIICTWILD